VLDWHHAILEPMLINLNLLIFIVKNSTYFWEFCIFLCKSNESADGKSICKFFWFVIKLSTLVQAIS